jgi:hypothetical protein
MMCEQHTQGPSYQCEFVEVLGEGHARGAASAEKTSETIKRTQGQYDQAQGRSRARQALVGASLRAGCDPRAGNASSELTLL